MGSCSSPISLNHSPSSSTSCLLPPTSSTHRCIGVSCCGCSRCRLAGRLWSSALWRRAGSHCCRSRSPVCRRSNQQLAHLRSLAHWAHRMTQLQAPRGLLLTLMFMHSTGHILKRFAERRLVNTGTYSFKSHIFVSYTHECTSKQRWERIFFVEHTRCQVLNLCK